MYWEYIIVIFKLDPDNVYYMGRIRIKMLSYISPILDREPVYLNLSLSIDKTSWTYGMKKI